MDQNEPETLDCDDGPKDGLRPGRWPLGLSFLKNLFEDQIKRWS